MSSPEASSSGRSRCKVGQRPQRVQGVYLRIPLVLDLRHAARLFRAALAEHRVVRPAGGGVRVERAAEPAGTGGGGGGGSGWAADGGIGLPSGRR